MKPSLALQVAIDQLLVTARGIREHETDLESVLPAEHAVNDPRSQAKLMAAATVKQHESHLALGAGGQVALCSDRQALPG